MRISLIGMAGSGKSFWSKRLAQQGFTRYCCDDLIAAKLAPELTRANGITISMGEWMGFPHEPRYSERESHYLAYEKEVLGEIIDYLENVVVSSDDKIVIDTTGSVIYTGEALLKRLRENTTLVYLSTPPEVQEQLLKAYRANPHPMLWNGMFSEAPHETHQDALARCYAKLFSSRTALYERLADVTIDYYMRTNEGFSVHDFFNEIREQQVSPLI
jgi:shikimate kinase